MACTSLKAVEEINVKQKIFRGKQVADMLGKLDFCGDVVFVVPTSVVNTPSHQVNVSTTRINAGGAE